MLKITLSVTSIIAVRIVSIDIILMVRAIVLGSIKLLITVTVMITVVCVNWLLTVTLIIPVEV